jgi:hypothetical protein
LPGKDGGASRIDLGKWGSGIFFGAGLDSDSPDGLFLNIALKTDPVIAGLDPVKPGHDELCGRDAQD